MSLFEIDKEKCTRDGFCATVCPVNIIEIKSGSPVSVKEKEKLCINCGHCAAVCPHEALTLHTMPMRECTPLCEELLISPERAVQYLKCRRSIRLFEQKPVEREILEKILDAARFAPTPGNSQPVNWTIINDNAKIYRIAEATIDWLRFGLNGSPGNISASHWAEPAVTSWDAGNDSVTFKAPHLIIAHISDEMQALSSACTIALTYLELAALSFGLGTCWSGLITIASAASYKVTRTLMLPEGHHCHGAMIIGYPKIRFRRIPDRNEAVVNWK